MLGSYDKAIFIAILLLVEYCWFYVYHSRAAVADKIII